MTEMEFLNEPIAVTSAIDDQGQVKPQTMIWRGRPYTIVSVGRQWDQTGNRHILIEGSDGSRFEIMLEQEASNSKQNQQDFQV